jgi:hypothetical protein
MESRYKKIFLYFNIFFFIVHIYGESGVKKIYPLYEFEQMIGQLEAFKSVHLRFPISLNEMITKPHVSYDLKSHLNICQRNRFIISYFLIANNEMIIKLQDNNTIYECKTIRNTFYFYKNGMLIREYYRNDNGEIINEKSYIVVDESKYLEYVNQ